MWKDMDTAPRDGTSVLAARDNGCGWSFYVVFWTESKDYPWQTDGTDAYPEHRLDYWMPLPEPPYVDDFLDS